MAGERSSESSMSEPEYPSGLTALIVDPNVDRATAIGTIISRTGAQWSHIPDLSDVPGHHSAHESHLVLIAATIIRRHLRERDPGVRSLFPDRAVLVGLMDTPEIDSPILLGAGLDLVIHDPVTVADIERAMVYVGTTIKETPEQTRDRLRRMTALHQLAISASRLTSSSVWLDRLIETGHEIIGADALAMWTLDSAARRLRCIGSSGLPETYIEAAEANSEQLVDQYPNLPMKGTSHPVTSVDERPGVGVVAPGRARRVGIERIAWVPVRDANRMYGHLSFYFSRTESFEKYDLILADAFASIVAASLGSYALQAEIHRSNRLYREHVEMSPYGVLVCHIDGTVERANMAISTIAGRGRYEILGNPVSMLFANPADVPWAEWLTLDYDDRDDGVMLWLVHPDGRRRRVSCYARRVELPQGLDARETEDRIQLVVEDVTVQARRMVELELLHDLTRIFSNGGSLQEAFDLVVDRLFDYFGYYLVCVGDVSSDGKRLIPRAFRTAGALKAMPHVDVTTGVCGRATRENRSILVHDVAKDPDYFSVDSSVHSELVSVIRAGGKPVGLLDIQTDSAHPLDDEDLRLVDSISAHLGLLIDQVTVTERLERQAMTDPLLGIANRRALMGSLNRMMQDGTSGPAALFLVELDHFKALNDRYGHLFGDEMLIQVGKRLKSVLRDEDLIARYGGDELAIIFRNVNSARALLLAERLRRTISDEPFTHDGHSVTLTVSIGIALFPTHGRTTDELIGEADRAMYTAKLAGRNRVHGEFVPQSG